MTLLDRVRNVFTPTRQGESLDFQEWVNYFSFGNFSPRMSWAEEGSAERIEENFTGYVTGAYKANGIVFACMAARQMLFSEARFQFRQMRDGQPGDLFGSRELALVEEPWPGGTTSDLLTRVILYADLAGTAFIIRRHGQLIVPRPDWMHIILGSMTPTYSGATFNDLHATVAGYIYHPGGEYSGNEPIVLDKSEVAYFAPLPDPLARWRGMSWLTPIVREIMGDSASALHKIKFLEKGATPNMIVTMDPTIDPDKGMKLIKAFREQHEGAANAYKTLFLGGGMQKAEVVGANLGQMDFRNVQAAGETRVAAASGIHPVLIGISEALAGSSLNQGNFSAARRLTADRTLRPLWRNMAGSLAHLINVPPASELWYDDRHIPFLMSDVQDQVSILQVQMRAIVQAVRDGFNPDDVIEAVVSGDLKRLKGAHTGLLSVQLQPPMDEDELPAALPARYVQIPSRASGEVRCGGCDALLAELASAPYRFTCRRCKNVAEAAA